MFRRRPVAGTRGPGLAGTVARTAVIAGTATATSNMVNAKAAQKRQVAAQVAAQDAAAQEGVAQLQQQVAELHAQQVQAQIAPAAPAMAADSGGDITAQLGQLAQLLQSGVLTQEEFNVAKAKVLGL